MDSQQAWYTVRCLFKLPVGDSGTYEERITLWRASSQDEALAMAETEATEYAADLVGEYLGLAQAYSMYDQPVHGAEVFSLLRESALAPPAYLDAFFDTGDERQGAIETP